MSTPPRWDAPWTHPSGSSPQRGPGEPSPALIAVLSLATLFGANVVAALLIGVSHRSDGAAAVSAGAFAAVLAAAGFVARSRRTPTAAWVADLALALAVGASALVGWWAAQAAGASSDSGALVAGLVALPVALGLYAAVRRTWVLTTVAGAATLLALAAFPDQQAQQGVALLLAAGLLAVAAASGVAQPVRAAFVLAALVAGIGSQQVLRDSSVGGSLVTLVLLVLVVWGVLRSNPSLLPVALIAGTVLLPQVLSPLLGGGRAFLLSLTFVAAGVAWLAADLSRRAVRPVQVGGVLGTCLLLLLLSQVATGFAYSGNDRPVGFLLLHAAGVVAFFVAAAAARRRAATVISGFFVLTSLPEALASPFGESAGAVAATSLLCLGGAVWAALWLDRKAPRPTAAPYQQELALSGAGRDWTVAGSYPQVFDAVVACFAAGGVPLQVVNRAAGRLVVGEHTMASLAIAIWATDPVQTHLRAVGQRHDVDRLEQELAARLKGLSAPH